MRKQATLARRRRSSSNPVLYASQQPSNRVRHRARRLLFEPLEHRRLLAVDWRNPVDSLDVDGDFFIAPIDALLVINDLNANGARNLPAMRSAGASYVDVDGDQTLAPIDALQVINALNDGVTGPRVLAEGAQLASETSVVLSLGQLTGSRSYRVGIEAAFDTSASGVALEDLLAVYLVDPDDHTQTLLDRGTKGTALFTLAGSRYELAPGVVRWDGSVLAIDITSLASRDTGELVFQLLKSDADQGTRITIRPLSNDVDRNGAASPILAAPAAPLAAGGAANLLVLSATNNADLQVENVRFDSTAGRYQAELRLMNAGQTLARNAVVTFPGLPAGVTLLNPSGTTADNTPYINLRPAIQRGGLQSGNSSEPMLVEFDDPSQIPFELRPSILASPNHAPVLDSVGTRTMFPGGVLKIPLQATDADGDPVTFAVQDLTNVPHGMLRGDGLLVFRPAPNQLGSYSFDVLASDGSAEVRQAGNLNVVADPVTTTRFSGQVLRVDGQPLVGMPVSIGGVTGLTNADGSFTLDLGNGPVVSDTLKIRGELFGGPESYPFIAEKLPFLLEHPIYERVNNVIDRPIFLPVLDLANGKTIDPMEDTNVTTEALPGVSVMVKAGTLMNQQGTPFTGVLSVTEVPASLTPAALPPNLMPDLVVTVQPGEMVFSAPAPMSFPNRAGWPAGTLMDLWSINPVTGEFDDVGDMQVSADGTSIATISGGVRNSSWHFPAPPPPAPESPDTNPRNPDDGCNQCTATGELNSMVELHSGADLETHELVPYQSLGTQRGVTLRYDSLRADPRPIVHLGYSNARGDSQQRLMAELSVRGANEFTFSVPGASVPDGSLPNGAHFWRLPTAATDVDVALQADLRGAPSGVYTFALDSGIVRYSDGRVVGSTSRQEGPLLHVNTIGSPFGSGWGIVGLQELVENPDGSLLLIDGDGSESLFQSPATSGGPYESPPGDFSTLTKLEDGTFVRALKDQTVYSFSSEHQLVAMQDRNGNQTKYLYLDGRLSKIVDPAGLEIVLAYSGGLLESVTDPAGRVTRFQYDSSNNLERITDPDGSARTWTYDGAHHMTSETDQRGNREQTFFDAAGRATRAIHKDGSEIVVQPVQVQGLSDPELTSNPDTAPLATNLGDAIARISDGNGNVRQTKLDRAGQAQAQEDGGGKQKTTSRNTSNLVAQQVDGNGHERRFSYDAAGNLIEAIDGNTLVDFQNVTRVNNGGVNELNAPTWIAPSPDGSFIYVTGDSSDSVVTFARNPGSGALTWVETIRDGVGGVTGLDGARGAVVSPDGGNLYVVSRNASTLTVFQRDVVTGKLTILERFNDNVGGVDGLSGARCVAIAPDGKYLYIASHTDAAVAVFARDPTTGTLTFVEVQRNGTEGVSGLDGSHDVSLSPDGTSVYATGTAENSLVVFQRDPNTGRLTFLERHQEGVNGETGLNGAFTSMTSPDGRYVYLASSNSDAVTMFRRNTATGQLTWLRTYRNNVDGFSGLDGAFCVAISPDSQFLYVTGYASNSLSVFRRHQQSGELSLVTQFTDGSNGVDGLSNAHAVATSPNGRSVYVVGFSDSAIASFTAEGELRVHFSFEPQFNQLTSMTDELGHKTLYDIDPANGNLVTMTRVVGDPGGVDDITTRYTYTPAGQIDTETDPLGRVTDYDYDARGLLSKVTYAVGSSDQVSYQYEYDLATVAGRAGLVTASVDGNGHRTTYEYDALNRRTTQTGSDPDGAGPLAASVMSWEYDRRGNVVRVTDPLGQVTSMEYDVLDRPTRTTGPDPDGAGPLPAPVTRTKYDAADNVVSVVDANGFETGYNYDSRDRLVSTTDPDGGVTRYTYDANNNRTSIVDPVGNATRFAYDFRNRRIRESTGSGAVAAYEFADSLDSPTGPTLQAIGPGHFQQDTVFGQQRQVYAFDYKSGLALRTTDVIPKDTYSIELVVRFEDVNGYQKIVDFENLTLDSGFYAYNGQLNFYPVGSGGTFEANQYKHVVLTRSAETKRVVGYLNGVEVISFTDDQLRADVQNANDLLTFFADDSVTGRGEASAGRVALLRIYDKTLSADEVAERAIDPLRDGGDVGGPRIFEYDAVGNRTSMTDRNSRRTQYVYDELNRLVQENWVGGGNSFTYRYDAAGNLLSASDQFSELTLTYDARDRVRSVDNLGTPGTPRVVLDYAYDAVGNVTSVADQINGAAGATTSYTYDGLDRLVQLKQSGASVAAKRVDFSYNLLGQYDSIDRYADLNGNQPSVASRFAYDEQHRLTRIAHDSPSANVAFYDYTYDPNGRITSITDIDGATTYHYDDRNQLTSADHSAAGVPDEGYTYDANGNRVTSHVHGDGYQTGPQNRLLSDGTFDYAYDYEGNLIRRIEVATGKVRDFQWDYRNRLTAIIDRDDSSNELLREEYTYDASNRRLSRTHRDATTSRTTHFVYDRDNVLLDFVDGDGDAGPGLPALDRRYLHGPYVDEVLAQQDAAGDVLWLLADRLGTIRDLANDAGTLVDHVIVDSFGNRQPSSGGTANTRFGFAGREFDRETGMHYFRRRYYDGEIGRFVSWDPMGPGMGDPNPYRYAMNNSIAMRDPLGLQAEAGGSAGWSTPGNRPSWAGAFAPSVNGWNDSYNMPGSVMFVEGDNGGYPTTVPAPYDPSDPFPWEVPTSIPRVQSAPGHIYSIDGDVTIRHGLDGPGPWEPAIPGMPLFPGDTIRTGDDSRAAIIGADGVMVRMPPNGMIKFLPYNEPPKPYDGTQMCGNGIRG